MKWIVWGLLIFLSTSFVLSYVFGITAEICASDNNTAYEQCSSHNVTAYIVLTVAEFVDRHEGAMTALATAILAFLTFNLTRITEHIIIADHRPNIKVRSFIFDNPTDDGNFFISFRYRNEGGTVARVSAIHYRTVLSHRVESIDTNMGDLIIANCDIKVKVGAEEAFTCVRESYGVQGGLMRGNLEIGNIAIFVVGCIVYTDPRNIEHRTGFIRKCAGSNLRFQKHEDDEWEYSY